MYPHSVSVSKNDTYLLLQVWRAFAAFLVLFGHVQHEAVTIAKGVGIDFNHFKYPTGVGVEIFFVISGFVIVYASQSLIGEKDTWKEFWRRRLIRVVPTYWFFTTLMLIVLIVFPSLSDSAEFALDHAIYSFLFIPHTNPGGTVYPILSLGWTLNYEMYFYAGFALFMFMPLKRLVGALSAFFVATALIWPFVPEELTAVKFWFSPLILEFLAGVLMGYCCIKGWRLPTWTLYPLIAFAFFTLYLLHAVPKDIDAVRYGLRGLVGVSFVLAATLPRGVEKMRPPKLPCALGDSSYALYLSHPFAIGVCKLLWVKLGVGAILNLWFFVAGTIIAAVIGAHIVHLFFEKPVIRYLKNKTAPSRD